MSAVLFDVPGPKSRVRHRLYAVVGVLAIAAVIGYVVYKFAEAGQFDADIWEWVLYKQIQLEVLAALGNTVKAFATAAVLASRQMKSACGELVIHILWPLMM